MAAHISGIELLRVSSILQDCCDQLAVLGHIMPDTDKRRAEADMVLSADISAVMEQHRAAEVCLKVAREARVDGDAVSEATHQLHRSQKELNRILAESRFSSDNLAKVQRDRQFLAQVKSDTLAELQEKGTFQSLWQALEEEKKRKANLQDIIIREEEGCLRAKALQRQLLDIRKEKTVALQWREEMTAHLKDQLQEMKVKTSLERKYVKSCAELLVYQGQKLNTRQEKQLEDEIKMLEGKLEEERRVHKEMESFLKEHQTYRESKQVIIEDRLVKDNLRRQLERAQLERNAAIKIQSWWRGTVVRKCLGPYKKAKKPKSKERKKGKKK
ncbi:dynein regulatory complex protein 9 isoform X1 [Electrophorus electricus]|uniref:dynein regulatory complex protein 9 isoform X1 n=1 Tax=Electrophorus electricus TaxID=8005 RepID=UPI0015CFC24C|nr:dynein regulatory complex protein 9 isoform X1 [Electrophorus electricus]